jgi:hypothetical protein
MKLVIPILLPIGEEEGFVFAVVEFRNPHGSADVESVIMPARTVAKVIGSIVGVEDIIDGVIVRRAVILVGARCYDLVEQHAGNRAVFRIEATGLNRDFLDRVGADIVARGVVVAPTLATISPSIRYWLLACGKPLMRGANPEPFRFALPGRVYPESAAAGCCWS